MRGTGMYTSALAKVPSSAASRYVIMWTDMVFTDLTCVANHYVHVELTHIIGIHFMKESTT